MGTLFDELKLFSEAGFRGIYKKFVYIHCRDLLDELMPGEIDDSITGVIAYSFIDRTEGISFRPIMVAAMKEDSLQVFTIPGYENTLYIFRFREGHGKMNEIHDGDNSMYLCALNPIKYQFLDLSVIDFDDESFREIKEDMDEVYDAGEMVEQLRSKQFSYLDKYRHEWYPDDVQAGLYMPDEGIERVWVRLTLVSENEEIFGELLNEPYKDFGCHQGDLIEIEQVNISEDDQALFFTGRMVAAQQADSDE